MLPPSSQHGPHLLTSTLGFYPYMRSPGSRSQIAIRRGRVKDGHNEVAVYAGIWPLTRV